jgi:predicted ATPase/class 3 adenylate cyclase
MDTSGTDRVRPVSIVAGSMLPRANAPLVSATHHERLPDESLPTGTVTFVFTDIEGSTQRWDRDRAAMQAAVRRHDELMRSAIVAHGGSVFKTIGDAFCAAFTRPEDAVAAMLSAQRALSLEDFTAVDGLRVRVAIHTGTADERDRDYFGPAVNRVARLLAIGHGGQVLVSRVTADLVRGSLPPQASLRDLGEHRLKDLVRPEHVYGLLAPDLAADFPPLRSLDARRNNLPLQLTSFIGREAEIAEITARIETNRLVTLVGAGGIGKTRTSLQVAANLLDGSGDGVWLIELAPLASGDYLPTTIASAFAIALPSEGDPVDNLVRALKSKHAFVVVDNCEHLVEPASRVVAALLHGCPKLKILASSRQALGIAGEIVYRVPSLGVPTEVDANRLRASDATTYPAMALFVERARAADQRFTLTDSSAPIIADICRRLDGIPFAIELAAARVNMLSPQQLRDHLNARFRLLTGGSRDALPRQKTLRALIDWSHDLLNERERTVFRRLGIFVNGFTLEGATAVASADDIDELDAFDMLASLVDKSLVLAEPRGSIQRYRLLESTRAYALEKLDAAGERAALAGRHVRYLGASFEKIRSLVERTGESAKLFSAMQDEQEDVRSALDGALARADVIAGAELLAAVDRTWVAIGLPAQGASLCERYLVALPADSRLSARVASHLAFLLGALGRIRRALEVAVLAVAHARACGDHATLAHALLQFAGQATLAERLDDAEAALSEVEGSPNISAQLRIGLLDTRAHLSFFRGDLETAARMHEQLRDEFRALGNTRNEVVASMNLAETEHGRGRTERAIAIMREILPSARTGTDTNLRINVLHNLAGYLVATGELSDAAAAAREALALSEKAVENDTYAAIALEHLALVFALRDDLSRAATLLSYVDTAFGRHGYKRGYTEQTTHERLRTLLQERLATDERVSFFARGAALEPQAALTLALQEP